MALQISNLCCTRQENILFSDLSFTLTPGSLLLITGANGTGKSSLLRLLSGLATPAHGDICWQGKSIQENLSAYQQQLHYVGHANGIRLELTVGENLGISAAHALRDGATRLLRANGVAVSLHTRARQLSAGQRRKLALARLFLSHKPLWLLDEPLTALDASTQTFFLEKLTEHLAQGGIAVVSSHQMFTVPDTHIQMITIGVEQHV